MAQDGHVPCATIAVIQLLELCHRRLQFCAHLTTGEFDYSRYLL